MEETMKPGYKTTEFWLTIATNVAACITTFAGSLSPEFAVMAIAVANGIYAVVRAYTKAVETVPGPVVLTHG